MASPRKFEKHPNASGYVRLNHARRMGDASLTIETVSVTAVDGEGNDITDDVIGDDDLPSRTVVRVYVFGGVHGLRATITFDVVLSDGQRIITDVVMMVKE